MDDIIDIEVEHRHTTFCGSGFAVSYNASDYEDFFYELTGIKLRSNKPIEHFIVVLTFNTDTDCYIADAQLNFYDTVNHTLHTTFDYFPIRFVDYQIYTNLTQLNNIKGRLLCA